MPEACPPTASHDSHQVASKGQPTFKSNYPLYPLIISQTLTVRIRQAAYGVAGGTDALRRHQVQQLPLVRACSASHLLGARAMQHALLNA